MKLTRAFAAARDFAWRALEGDEVLVQGLLLALSLRLLIAPFFSDTLNFYGFHLTASFAASLQNPWISIASDPAVARFNPWGYPPAYLVPVLSAEALSLGNGFVFGLLIRAPLIGATLLTSAILFRTGRELGLAPDRARLLALAYAFCPYTLLVDTIGGGNDPLAVMFTAGAVFYGARREPRYELAALLLGLGLSFKVYPVVILPLLIAAVPGWRRRGRVALLAALPGLITAGPVLVESPSEFLRTLGLFVVGAGADASSLSLPWLLRSQAGIGDPLVSTALTVLFIAGLAGLAFLIHRKKMTFLAASTAAVLLLFLVASRLGYNYYLWAVPFLMTAGAAGLWSKRVAFVANLSWVPFAALALIYNGAAGVTGLAYWALIAGAPRGQPYLLVPPWTAALLVALFLAMVALAVVSLVFSRKAQRGILDWGRLKVPFSGPLLTHARAVTAASLGLCVLFSLAVSSIGAHFLPDDYGTYTTRDGRVTVTDEFASSLFPFTYDRGGSGFFWLNESGSGTLELDTVKAGGNAYFVRALPNKAVDIALRVRVERVDGPPGLLMVARLPAGWVGIQIVAGAFHLVYLDDGAHILQDFGPVGLGSPMDISVTLSLGRTVVRYAGLEASGSGAPVDRILLGHYDSLPYGGGRMAFDRLALSWDADPRAESPGVVGATLVGTAVALAAPVWIWRRRGF